MRPAKMDKFLRDGGFKSRKLWLAMFCLALLAVFLCVAAKYPAVAGLYSEFVTGVIGLYSVYVTGNAVGRWGTAKHIGSKMVSMDIEENEEDSLEFGPVRQVSVDPNKIVARKLPPPRV